jgi:ribosome-associated protein
VTLRWSVEESGVLSNAQRARLCERLASRLTRRGAIVVHADATRSRSRNRQLARERLASLVRDGLATRRSRRATRPGSAARGRRMDAKRRRGHVKQTRGRVRDHD